MNTNPIVPLAVAAKELHMDVLTLRYLMNAGKIDIGDCGRRPGCKRGFYKVYRVALDREKEKRGIL